MERGQFYNLEQLLSCYLHQDWDLDFPDADGAIEDFVKHSSPDQLRVIEQELIAFIVVAEKSENSSKLLMELGCYYYPAADGVSDVEWLLEVLSKFQKKHS